MKILASFSATNLLQKPGTLIERLFADKLFAPKNIQETFNILQAFGVTGVEMYLHNKFTNEEVVLLKKILNTNNIRLDNIRQPMRILSNTYLPEVKSLFSAAKLLGTSRIVLHSDMAGKQFFDKKYIREIKNLEKKYKIYACFENMQHHYIVSRNAYYWHPEKFQKIIQQNDLFMTLDTTHMAQVGGDIIEFFQMNKQHIQNIHLSDFKSHHFSGILANYRMHMPLGKGELPIKNFLETLKKEKYTGTITMEITGSLEELCQSAKMIQKYTN